VVLCTTKRQAEKALEAVRQCVEEELGLSLNPDKTRVTTFGQGFTFLGYAVSARTIRMGGKAEERFKMKIKALTKHSHNLDAEVIMQVNRVIRGTVRRQLTYKGKLTGTQVVVVDRWFPSSKMCSQCGTYHEGLTLATRTMRCACGFVGDRDVNAAINLARVGYTRSHACGDTSDGGTMATSVYESRGAEAGTTPCALLHTM
jgi:hypothetical protein